MPFGLDLAKGIKFYLKRSMLLCFGPGNHKGEMLPFKAFQTMGNQGKRALNVRTFFLQIQYRLYFNDINHIYSLNWCKCLQDICIHRKQFSERTIMTVVNVNMNAVLQT